MVQVWHDLFDHLNLSQGTERPHRCRPGLQSGLGAKMLAHRRNGRGRSHAFETTEHILAYVDIGMFEQRHEHGWQGGMLKLFQQL